MTLVVVTQVDLVRGTTLIVAADSMLSAGYRWPRGPKLFNLGSSCVVAFEGDTAVAYPLLINAANFIALSDNLSRPEAEPAAIFSRVQLDVSEAYNHLIQSNYFTPGQSTCSLILVGWSWRLDTAVVQVLSPPAPSALQQSQWVLTDVAAGTDWQRYRCFFAGNGDRDPAAEAWADMRASPTARLNGYSAFLARVHDVTETSVGGAPQVAVIGNRTREFLGIQNAQGNRFLLGHRVQSGAHGMAYYDEQLTALV